MKYCIECGAQLDDETVFCTQCGTKQLTEEAAPVAEPAPAVETPAAPVAPVVAAAPQEEPKVEPQPQPQPQPQPTVAPAPKANYDHTAEMDPEDVSKNKVLAMVVYLSGFIGIIVAALVAKESKFIQFHIRQCLKLQVAAVLAALVMALSWWTIVGAIAAFVVIEFIAVLEVIQFVQVCMGKSIEPIVIRELKFMK